MEEKMTFRESAFIFIFENMFLNEPTDVLFEQAEEIEGITAGEKTRTLVDAALTNIDEIQSKISQFSPTRAYPRIPKLNAAVLITAFAEILYTKKAPVNVTVSEAMKIVKKYGLDNDVKFVNGVLGAFSRSL